MYTTNEEKTEPKLEEDLNKEDSEGEGLMSLGDDDLFFPEDPKEDDA